MSRTVQAERSDADTVIEVRDTSVTFDMDRGKSRVLDSVNLDVRRGEILGVIGESGAGKSMFASALIDAVVDPGVLNGDITYYPADEEPVDVLELDDEGVRQLRWRDISFVFQGALSSWNPTMTFEAHFKETIRAHDVSMEEGMKRGRELLRELYLDPDRVLDSYPHELSGGMKQRMLIALSLVLDPEVLVLDEPTAALDLLMQRSIITLLGDLQEEYDLTMVFVTHDLELLADLADRLAVMYAFEFVEVGTPRELILDSKHPYTRSLINSTPNLDTPIDKMHTIPGESPDPVETLQGCSYHPRCQLADDLCETSDPPLEDVGEGHRAACHYWEDVDEEIPLSIEGGAEP